LHITALHLNSIMKSILRRPTARATLVLASCLLTPPTTTLGFLTFSSSSTSVEWLFLLLLVPGCLLCLIHQYALVIPPLVARSGHGFLWVFAVDWCLFCLVLCCANAGSPISHSGRESPVHLSCSVLSQCGTCWDPVRGVASGLLCEVKCQGFGSLVERGSKVGRVLH